MIVPAHEATQDTPTERDEKAEELKRLAAETAAVLAADLKRDLKRFRWETRLGYSMAIVVALIAVTS